MLLPRRTADGDSDSAADIDEDAGGDGGDGDGDGHGNGDDQVTATRWAEHSQVVFMKREAILARGHPQVRSSR